MSIENNSNLRKDKCQEKKISQSSLGDLQAGILPYIGVTRMSKKLYTTCKKKQSLAEHFYFNIHLQMLNISVF
jgi:hypothetical protein